MRHVNARSAFIAAWVCGAGSFMLGRDELTALGGGLLLVAAVLVAARPDDPVNRMFAAIPSGPLSLRGAGLRWFTALVFALIGAAWLVGGVAAAT